MTVVDPYAEIARVLGGAEDRVRCYVALGDSFTAGTGCEPGEAWADRLAARLGAGDPEFVYRNLGVEGATSAEVLEQLGDALQLEPDLVTVVCGVNDVLFSVRPDHHAYARRLAGIFRRLREALPAVRVATATAPERFDFLELGPRTRRRLERGIVRFNAATRTVASAHEVPCLDAAGHPGLGEAENFVADGLHPSPLGHRRAAIGFGHLLGLDLEATDDEEER
jgi:lysophospholipase L1-like esterase